MNTIIFIDDDIDVRETYQLAMSIMFSDDFKILCLDVEPSLESMIQVLNDIPDKVTYFIDEKLKHSGVASYTGVELVERIRMFDSKIPIYILTSFSDEIEKYLGNIEFVIDKNDWELSDDENNLTKRFLRHINTYKDIKSQQAKRFDFLLEKSIFSTLSDNELEEFKALDLSRVKNTTSEGIISEASLDELNIASNELDAIYLELRGDDDK
nr:MAG TPA: biodegradative arginine decarboxylase [Caudoviricetes sp.]